MALVLTCSFLGGAASQAAILTSATWVGSFQGTSFTLVTSGGSLTATGSRPRGGATLNVALTVAPPAMTSLIGTGPVPFFTSQTLGGSQTINSSLVANQGVRGSIRTYVAADSNGTLLVSVPLSVGVGGQFQATSLVPRVAIPVEVTATYFPWTTGTQILTGLTGTTTTANGQVNHGVSLPDFVTQGSPFVSGFNGAGRMTLVAPTRTRICVGEVFGSFPCVSGSAANIQSSISATATRLTLNFGVPEPGTLLLGGAIFVGFAARRFS